MTNRPQSGNIPSKPYCGLFLLTLAAYFFIETSRAASLPVAPPGAPLPAAEQRLTTILVASCLDEERPHPAPVLQAIARERADLLLMVGDNVYGDYHRGRRVRADPSLTELRESFAELAGRADCQAVRKHLPIMVAWDDHDYGLNDGGGDFPHKLRAEKIHEHFWGLEQAGQAAWPGTYYGMTFGPVGQRVQILMLDTRFFRSALTVTDRRNAPGRERYLPSQATDQQMLGAAQWQWLAARLQEPAELRLIVSSIQVLPSTGHGFESWSRLPVEQSRLLKLVTDHGANDVVFVSGDRHRAFLYRRPLAGGRALHELTSSSVNRAFRAGGREQDPAQVGTPYAGENYGSIQIDWASSQLELQIKNARGEIIRRLGAPFAPAQ